MTALAPRALLLCAIFASACERTNDGIPVPPGVRQAYERGTRNRSGAPGRNYWQLWPRYDLSARLDPESATLLGSGTLSFVNRSPDAFNEIVLRLDQNRFRDGRDDFPKTRGIDIRKLEINGALTDLGGNAVSGLGTTVVRVRLSKPLATGDSLKVYTEWDYEVALSEPGQALRQGRTGTSVYQIAQWYPRLAMYDDLAGWDTTAHDGWKEFFNPFGTFRVQLQAPPGWLVGATGTLRNAQEVLSPPVLARLEVVDNNDTALVVVAPGERGTATVAGTDGVVLWRFEADSVGDFAWGTSSEYTWAVASRTLASGKVRVHALMTPTNSDSILASSSRAAAMIHMLSGSLMSYAGSDHTLLDGPETGMEYPGLTMTNLDERLAHEIAHQWFPMMVGSDETRFDFLDEGFANFYAPLASGGSIPAAVAQRASMGSLLDSSDVRNSNAVLGYGRGQRMLSALAAQVGEAELLAALRSYAVNWRFKHPSPWDFVMSMETALRRNLEPFWRQWLFSAEAITAPAAAAPVARRH